MSIDRLKLHTTLAKNLGEFGVNELTDIQSQCWEPLLEERDLIGVDVTGSGKTLAFLLPMLQRCLKSDEDFDILIMEPTRELVLQVHSIVNQLIQETDVKVCKVMGGSDLEWCDAPKRVIVATPGRLLKTLADGDTSLAQVKSVVIDEADEFIEQGFINELLQVFSSLTHEHQSTMFSATMSKAVEKFAVQCMNNPVKVNLLGAGNGLMIDHLFKLVLHHRKFDALVEALNQLDEDQQCLIFCNSKFLTERVFKQLMHHFKKVAWINSDMEQADRNAVIKSFRDKVNRILVASDLAARGLDVKDLQMVISYDLPQVVETYTHRSGRTGRMGKTGLCLSFIEPDQLLNCKAMLDKLKFEVRWDGPVPDFEAEKRKTYAPQNRNKNMKGQMKRPFNKKKYR